jgi:hypothetical protein
MHVMVELAKIGGVMGAVLLAFSIVAMGAIIFWYVFDEAARGGQAESGLLGMLQNKRTQKNDPGWKGGSRNRPWRIGRR